MDVTVHENLTTLAFLFFVASPMFLHFEALIELVSSQLCRHVNNFHG